MPDLKATQDAFMQSIYSRTPAPAEPVVKDGAAPKDALMEIYWKHTYAALTGVLKQSYPAILKLVGEKFFTATAREFIGHYPARVSDLEYYGAEFGDFLEKFEPAESLPYLADVARLEWAVQECRLAPAAGSLKPEGFNIPEAALMRLKLALHPSVRLLTCEHPASKIYQFCIENPEGELDISTGAEALLVCLVNGSPQVRPLVKGEYVFLTSLQKGASLHEALQQAEAEYSEFELEIMLNRHMVEGVFQAASTIASDIQPNGDDDGGM